MTSTMDVGGNEETSASIFSFLPDEIIHHILEISLTSDSSRQTCLSLCLVASWTRNLALPHLFSTIVLTDGANPLVCNAATGSDTKRELNFYPEESDQFVRNVWCVRDWPEAIIACAQLCPGLVNLSVASDDIYRILEALYRLATRVHNRLGSRNHARDLAVPNVACTLREVHFQPILEGNGYDQAWMTSPLAPLSEYWLTSLLQGVTRMFLSPVQSTDIGSLTQRLPCLTHLAVAYTSSSTHQCSDLLPLLHHPSLQMLVLAVMPHEQQDLTCLRCTAENWVCAVREESSNVYLVHYETDINLARIDWEKQARGGESVWERAVRETEDWIRDGPSAF